MLGTISASDARSATRAYILPQTFLYIQLADWPRLAKTAKTPQKRIYFRMWLRMSPIERWYAVEELAKWISSSSSGIIGQLTARGVMTPAFPLPPRGSCKPALRKPCPTKVGFNFHCYCLHRRLSPLPPHNHERSVKSQIPFQIPWL